MREASPPVIVSPNEDIRVMYYASSTIVWKVEIIFFFLAWLLFSYLEGWHASMQYFFSSFLLVSCDWDGV
jgi:hypothetical protein